MFHGDLGGALLDAAERYAERWALWAGPGARLTYSELFDKAASIAATLQGGGVGPNQRVAILARRNATPYAAVIGAALAGCTYTPLNTRFSKDRNQTILEASEAAVLVLDDSSAAAIGDLLGPLDDRLVVIQPESEDPPRQVGGRRAETIRGEGPEFWRSARRPVGREDYAYLLFTSGTTGKPKGVPISHQNLDAYLTGVSGIDPIVAEDKVLQMVELTFDPSVHDMFLAWLNGAELYSLPEGAGSLAPRMIARYGLTACHLVPVSAATCLQQGLAKPDCMPSLRLTYFIGEALPRDVASGWSKAAPNSRVFNVYGPTEATVAVSGYEFDEGEAQELSVCPIGRPWGDQMKLFTPDLTEVEPGGAGQLTISGPQLMDKYWNNPAVDAEKFVEIDGVRWYKTGDLGRWVEPYGFVFLGRADRQLKVRGYLVELQEIEGVLRRVTGRNQVAIIAWPMRSEGSADGLVAFICGPEMDRERLWADCREAMGDYMTPDRFVFVDELPVNSNGKVDHKVLAAHPSLREPARADSFAATS